MHIIPKQEFGKLRKYVLDYLKRNSASNGYCNIRHDGLRSLIMYDRDLKPFAGIRPDSAEEAEATDRFWQALLNARQVEMVLAPVSLDGALEKHYYLPGTSAFHPESVKLHTKIMEETR